MKILLPNKGAILSRNPTGYVWTVPKLMELIKLFKESEILWNPHYPGDKNRELSCDAWEALADKLGVGVGECRRKMSNLTTQFHREYRKEAYLKQCGENFSSPWFPYPHLLFLKKRRAIRRFKQSFPRLSPEPEDDSNGNEEGAEEMEDTGILTGPLTAEDLNILPEPGGEEPEFNNNSECAEPVNKRVKVETCEYPMGFPSSSSASFGRAENGHSNEYSESRQDLGNSSQDSDDLEYVSEAAAVASPVKPKPSTSTRNLPGPNAKPVARVAQNRDICSIFGEYVAAKLRSLNTDAARNRVECLIANILFEATRGKFDHSDPTSDIIGELQSFFNSTKDLQTLKSENCEDSCTDVTLTDRAGINMDLNVR